MNVNSSRLLLRIILVSFIVIGGASVMYKPNPDDYDPFPWPFPWPIASAILQITFGVFGLILENRVFNSKFKTN